MRILFCDLQYSAQGSFDDDIQAIRSALTWAEIDYYKDDLKASDLPGLARLLSFIRRGRFDRVVFLSARLTVAFALSFVIRDLHCIYHFLPDGRRDLHLRLLRLMRRRVRFGVYGAGLCGLLETETGVRAIPVPSRRLDLDACVRLYEEKARESRISILVPGVRRGVRDPIDLQDYVNGLRAKGYEIGLVRIQGEFEASAVEVPVEKVSGYADQAAYSRLFRYSTFVIMHFTPEYELRASGMVLDAVSNGCMVLAVDHPICRQYGFPRFPLCSIDGLERQRRDAASIRRDLLGSSIIFDHDFSEAWKRYLCP
jgi:hypothetical protein